jgi:hypothetical protein
MVQEPQITERIVLNMFFRLSMLDIGTWMELSNIGILALYEMRSKRGVKRGMRFIS